MNQESTRPLIMGILNVTPDSFSDGGSFFEPKDAIAQASKMLDEGADWIDVGGESTRPGSTAISAEEELNRVLPILKAFAKNLKHFSIDTQKPEVARAALDLGVGMVNDVSGFTDAKMIAVVGEFKPHVCVMHMKGTPKTMQSDPFYVDVVDEVKNFLNDQASKLRSAGLLHSQIWLDPGIGFGKTLEQNLELLRNLDQFTMGENPILIGVSRKSFIQKAMNSELAPDERLPGTLAVQTVAQLRGAKMLRVHDVKEAIQAAVIAELVS